MAEASGVAELLRSSASAEQDVTLKLDRPKTIGVSMTCKPGTYKLGCWRHCLPHQHLSTSKLVCGQEAPLKLAWQLNQTRSNCSLAPTVCRAHVALTASALNHQNSSISQPLSLSQVSERTAKSNIGRPSQHRTAPWGLLESIEPSSTTSHKLTVSSQSAKVICFISSRRTKMMAGGRQRRKQALTMRMSLRASSLTTMSRWYELVELIPLCDKSFTRAASSNF